MIDVETGADALAAVLPPGPEPAAVWCPRSPVGWDAVVAEAGADEGPPARFRGFEPPDRAFAYGLADRRPGRSGPHSGPPERPAWSRPVDARPDRLWQPPNFPLLVLVGERAEPRPGGRAARRSVLSVLDRRTGEEVFARTSATRPTPLALAFPPRGGWAGAGGPVLLRTRAGDVAFRTADGPPADPVRLDRPAPTGTPADPDGS